MRSTIICIGNRFINEDAAAMLVFAKLQELSSPQEKVQIHEGGIAGLHLLPLLELGGRVVFIDAVAGFTQPGEIILLSHQEIMEVSTEKHYGHEAGLVYLLSVLPKVCDGVEPEEIILVGLEGLCSPQRIKQAARLSMTIATHGVKDLR